MVKVTLPEMGESVTEGSIVEWRKRVGEFVAEGDALVDVTTDKVDVEVPATASGVITQILAGEGDTVSVGSVLAEIDTTKTNGQAGAKAAAAPSSNGGHGREPSDCQTRGPRAGSSGAAKCWPISPRGAWRAVSTSTSRAFAGRDLTGLSSVPT